MMVGVSVCPPSPVLGVSDEGAAEERGGWEALGVQAGSLPRFPVGPSGSPDPWRLVIARIAPLRKCWPLPSKRLGAELVGLAVAVLALVLGLGLSLVVVVEVWVLVGRCESLW